MTAASQRPLYYIVFLAPLVADQMHGGKEISWLYVHVPKCVLLFFMSVHISRVYNFKEIVFFIQVHLIKGKDHKRPQMLKCYNATSFSL